MPFPLVAIVGVPNVGKSTLFNRLTGRRRALVTDEPGVTRDRIYGVSEGPGRPFRVVDTGGLTPGVDAPFSVGIEAQAEAAMAEAALVLFVVDAKAGPSALDRELARKLRRRGARVLLLANKIDSPAQEARALELHELGLGDPIALSAEHGRGLPDLHARIEEALADVPDGEEGGEGEEDAGVRIALVGRPNVGKSSLLNRLLGEERVLVSEVPGTTRDSVDTVLRRDGRRYVLVDTAGMRRRGRVSGTAEVLSVAVARRSVERADVVVLVLDATEPFAAQDAHVAGYASEAFRPVVVAVNKWDLVEGREEAAKAWQAEVGRRLRFVKEAPVVLVSARSGQRVSRILDLAWDLHQAAGRRVPTPELNRWLEQAARGERESPARGRSIRLYYAVQTGVRPPTFLLFCNDASLLHFSMRRRLENGLRERFGFGAVPLRLRFRSRREAAAP